MTCFFRAAHVNVCLLGLVHSSFEILQTNPPSCKKAAELCPALQTVLHPSQLFYQLDCMSYIRTKSIHY